jgi:hypothetical protein
MLYCTNIWLNHYKLLNYLFYFVDRSIAIHNPSKHLNTFPFLGSRDFETIFRCSLSQAQDGTANVGQFKSQTLVRSTGRNAKEITPEECSKGGEAKLTYSSCLLHYSDSGTSLLQIHSLLIVILPPVLHHGLFPIQSHISHCCGVSSKLTGESIMFRHPRRCSKLTHFQSLIPY